MFKAKIFKIVLIFIYVQFHYLKSENEQIVLTLQYHNSRMVSRTWDLDELKKMTLFKDLIDDVKYDNKNLNFKLLQDFSHITHTYLESLIKGNVTQDELQQYIKDYNYFIGNNDIPLYNDLSYASVKEKILKEHYKFFFQNNDNKFLYDFASLDLDYFLKEKLNQNFKDMDINYVIRDNIIKESHEEIINLVKPALTITIKPDEKVIKKKLITIKANRLITITSPALFNLIKLIAWRLFTTSDPYLAQKRDGKDDLYIFCNDFFPAFTIDSQYLIFNGLHLDKIAQNIDSITFKDSKITILNNDINKLKDIQKKNITKPAPGPLNFYGPYIDYSYGGKRYEKHSLTIEFTDTEITNPNKLLALFDIYNGYFQTILIKNAKISQDQLKIKQFLCRKPARIPFLFDMLLNIGVIIILFKRKHWIFGLLSLIFLSAIQKWYHYKIIDFPENAASRVLKEPVNTNGGVTFES